jgi:hypothetical protein
MLWKRGAAGWVLLKEIIGPRMADSGAHRPGQGYCDTATKPGLQGSAVLYHDHHTNLGLVGYSLTGQIQYGAPPTLSTSQRQLPRANAHTEI